MNNLLIGGFDPIRGRGYAYYETLCGGAGGSPQGPGASAVHTHMTNTRNTPIEALEMHYPLRVQRYEIREDSGGSGPHPGGDGIIRELKLLADSHVSIVSERRRHPPHGRRASPAAPGVNFICLPSGDETELPSKSSDQFPAGTIVTIWTPGGGGCDPAN
jgi:N-methylhydantoinase B